MSVARLEHALDRLAALAGACKALAPRLERVAARYVDTLRNGGTLFFCGNGGSAADAQHLATEYVVRYAATRRPFAAIALSTDSSVLTAAGNDLGFEQIFARQVQALCRPGDLLVLHSTSGRSANLIEAARAARGRGTATVAFLGRGGGPLAAEVDDTVVVPSEETSQIQVLHLALEHLIVELVESALPGQP
ncbi:MAG: SIS domain-containing protein [Gemmatimonadota bacterium]|nr:SIS domain-containing protein [Gemmatimonadota bacterium]